MKIIKRLLKWFGMAVVLALAATMLWGIYAFRDRNPGYTLDIDLSSGGAPGALKAGFARQKITPSLTNRSVFLAGFSQNRTATAVHDDLWAVACVLDNGARRVGVVVLDAIGFFHDDVVKVRSGCAAEWKLDYVVVCSTHNHSTPDLMGLWGRSPFKTGVDPDYRQHVIRSATQSLGEAVRSLEAAEISILEIPMHTEGLVTDTRKPVVFDPDIRVLHFRSPAGDTLGTIVNWSNHPETPWSKNREITSDFCGFLRDALANGFAADGKDLEKGVGGLHLFVNGSVGGLITTSPNVTVRDPWLGTDYKEPSHEKSRAVGHQLVARILPALKDESIFRTNALAIGIRAKTVEIPLANKLYYLAGFLGLIDRGHKHWGRLRSEVALLTLNEASIACVPGEIYPEIVNGGIESPTGADYAIEPVERPSIRELMPGKIKFIFGLANDEIGYIIPKSEWDQKPPYLYDAHKGVYGEVNSCGPETAPILHAAFRDLCRD